MTTDDQAAHQDHLRHAARRQRGAARRVRGGRRRASGPSLGGHHRNYVDGAWRDGDGHVRGPLADRLATSCSARSRPGTAADVDDAVAAARAAQPAWADDALAGAARDPRARRRAHQRPAHGRRRRSWPSRSARTGSRRSARSRSRPTCIRYYAQTMEDNAATTTRWATSATRPSTPARSCGRTACSRSSARSTSRWRSPPGPTSAAMLAGNTVVLKPSSASPLSAVKLMEAYIDAGVPAGRRQPGHGPGRDGRPGAPGPPRHRRHRVHRLVRGRDAAVPLVQPDVAAAVHRRDGRQEPGHRVAQRRPRGGGRGDHALAPSGSAGRSARRTRGSTSSGRSTTSSSGCWSRRPRRSPSATRSSGRTGSARSSTSGRSTGTRPRSPRRAATARSSSAASG